MRNPFRLLTSVQQNARSTSVPKRILENLSLISSRKAFNYSAFIRLWQSDKQHSNLDRFAYFRSILCLLKSCVHYRKWLKFREITFQFVKLSKRRTHKIFLVLYSQQDWDLCFVNLFSEYVNPNVEVKQYDIAINAKPFFDEKKKSKNLLNEFIVGS